MAKFNAYKVHEARMLAKDIIIPTIGFVTGFILSDDEKREKVKGFCIGIKDKAIGKYKEVFHKV